MNDILRTLLRVSFRIFIKGGGGGKCDNGRVEGGKDYSNTLGVFLLARNIIVHIDFLKLGRLGACSPRKFFNFSISKAVSCGF